MTPEEFDMIVENEKKTSRTVASFFSDENPCIRERLASEAELQAFEQQFACSLPRSYRHVALKYGCGDFVYATLLSPLPESEMYIGSAPSAIRNDFVAVAENGCGDYYGFPRENGICRDAIVFADHETQYETRPSRYADFFSFLVQHGLRNDAPRG
jgi:hypothetical protein